MKAPATKRQSEIFNLDAARAARTEARGDDFEFIMHGQQWHLPGPREWPIQVTERLSQAKLLDALRLLMGHDQAEEFLEAGPIAMGDLESLFEAVAKWAGLDSLPNS